MKEPISKAFNARSDIYSRVTDRILSDLEKGARPWFKPWSGGNTEDRITRPLRHNGEPYRGVNVLMLWSEAMDKGYIAPIWMTFKQALHLKGHVRKGEHGTLVIHADTFTKTGTDDKGEEVEQTIPFMKGYTVFNVEQIDGLPDRYYPKPEPKGEPARLIEEAEAFFKGTGATIRHGGDSAFYAPGPDLVQLPPPESFKDPESYEAIKAHELTHWTSHPLRLAREFSGKRFGDEGYAFEELVAELGSAFLCVDLGITPEPREDHASYLSSWLKVLKRDNRAIVSAAAHAQKAVDYLHQIQGPTP